MSTLRLEPARVGSLTAKEGEGRWYGFDLQLAIYALSLIVIGLLMAFILVCVSIGGMVQIFPLIFEGNLSKPIDTLKPLTAVQLEGRDIYMREGCAVCHTQMVRPLQHETARYGHYSVAGEDAYEHPFLWGSKRTGPDLARHDCFDRKRHWQ